MPLSPVELGFCHLEDHASAAFRVVAICRCEGIIEPELLRTALHRLQHRQPKLRTVVTKLGRGRSEFRFERNTPTVPLDIRDHAGEEGPWREEASRLFRTPFPERGPLMRVTVLRNIARNRCDMVVTLHHAVADGVSACAILHDLLTEYAVAEARRDVAPRPPLLPVRVTRAKSPGGFGSKLWLLRRLWSIQRRERSSPQTRLPESAEVAPQAQWVRWEFTREQSAALVRRCKTERASLRAALVAAACRGLGDCLPQARAAGFKVQFPFDVRAMLETAAAPLTNEDLGCFATVANDFIDVPQSADFWELARQNYESTKVFVQHGGPAFYYNLASRMSRVFSLLPQKDSEAKSNTDSAQERREERPTIVISNFGVINLGDQYGSLRPSGCTFVFRHEGSGPMLMLHSLIMGERLHVSFSADRLDPGFWEQLQAAVLGHLEAAAC